LFQQRLPSQAVVPPPLVPLTLPPAPSHFRLPNLNPHLQNRAQLPAPAPRVLQPDPPVPQAVVLPRPDLRALPYPNFNLPLWPMPRLLAHNFPPFLLPAQPAQPPAGPSAPVPPLPAPALPTQGTGQPRPTVFVPQFMFTPPAPIPLPQPLPDNMRVTRSLRHHNNFPLLPPLTAIYKQSPFIVNPSVASGPSLVSDIYSLPLVCSGFRTPPWIKHH
jgi:hypothetical protein